MTKRSGDVRRVLRRFLKLGDLIKHVDKLTRAIVVRAATACVSFRMI